MRPLSTMFWIVVAALLLSAASPSRADAPSLELRDLQGTLHRPLEIKAEAAVLVFVLHDCPISNAYAPELNRLSDWCRQNDVSMYLVHADTEVKDEELRKHAKDFGYTCTVLADRKRELVKRLGATVAPQAFVLDKTGAVQYRGRIDDRYAGFGKKRAEPTTRDLRTALAAVLTGTPVAEPSTTAIGCSIE